MFTKYSPQTLFLGVYLIQFRTNLILTMCLSLLSLPLCMIYFYLGLKADIV